MPDDLTGTIQNTNLTDALSERYLAYAMSTIMSRSLPDVRDGLKPVHRRLIYAMHQLKLDPASGFKKCARVVGDVIGKYHPHGDASVYEALVRLAQEFAARYPLVEGQGNFGNIDGDNPAAMRYTEARLTKVAQALLAGIDDNAVDFRPTYDGEESEPLVLPGGFPNLLANGAAGIAVGMATSIPPHNAGEICAAAIHLIGNPNATTAELLAHMPGPDFPTGGILIESKDSILTDHFVRAGVYRRTTDGRTVFSRHPAAADAPHHESGNAGALRRLDCFRTGVGGDFFVDARPETRRRAAAHAHGFSNFAAAATRARIVAVARRDAARPAIQHLAARDFQPHHLHTGAASHALPQTLTARVLAAKYVFRSS